ncbi:hypothetical protein [Paenibacillus koleovorans]|nr:hypothetical protein [Paenibacillus koleovorans]
MKTDKENEPINDVTEHYQKIMGTPNKKVDLSTLPNLPLSV